MCHVYHRFLNIILYIVVYVVVVIIINGVDER